MSLKLSNLDKHYGSTVAVRRVKLECERDEFIVLLGPSGCGKTTLLRIIAGLEKPDSGTISMNDISWNELSPQERNVAMVFQQFALYPHRTVRGNIAYPLRVRKLDKAEIDEKVRWIAELLHIEDLLDRRPGKLSGGEAQRVALARALVRNPSCFLLDEPLSNLDARLRLKARADIKRIQQKLKITTIYVTHDQEEALALADRIAVMDKGRIVQIGAPEELLLAPATTFVAQFLGKPPINLIKATIESTDSGEARLRIIDTAHETYHLPGSYGTALLPGSKIIIGARPYDIKLEALGSRNEEIWHLRLEGEVEKVERLEHGYSAHFRCSDLNLAVFCTEKPNLGVQWACLQMKDCLFFDADSGRRIT